MYFPFPELNGWDKRFVAQPKPIYSEVPHNGSKGNPVKVRDDPVTVKASKPHLCH